MGRPLVLVMLGFVEATREAPVEPAVRRAADAALRLASACPQVMMTERIVAPEPGVSDVWDQMCRHPGVHWCRVASGRALAQSPVVRPPLHALREQDLEFLLLDRKVRRIALCGVGLGQDVMRLALEAQARGLEVWLLLDACAVSQSSTDPVEVYAGLSAAGVRLTHSAAALLALQHVADST